MSFISEYTYSIIYDQKMIMAEMRNLMTAIFLFLKALLVFCDVVLYGTIVVGKKLIDL